MEEGEIVDSDEEVSSRLVEATYADVSAKSTPQPPVDSSPWARSVSSDAQARTSGILMSNLSGNSAFSYRATTHTDVHRKVDGSSDSENSKDGEVSSSDSDAPGENNRSRPNTADKHSSSRALTGADSRQRAQFSCSAIARGSTAKASRLNNVWGSVLLEQTLTKDLVDVGVTAKVCNDRNVESYDYGGCAEAARSENTSSCGDSDSASSADATQGTESRRNGRQRRRDKAFSLANASSSSSRTQSSERGNGIQVETPHPDSERSRRISVKQRLGQASQPVIVQVTDESTPEDIGNFIANNLNEPKGELMGRIVSTLGKQKALALYNRTRDVEDAGGLLTMDGSRRRTPGGVYIQLLKTDKDVTKQNIRDIFAIEQENVVRDKKRRRKQRENVLAKKKKSVSVAVQQPVVAPSNGIEMKESRVCADDAALLANDPDVTLE